MNTSTPVRPHRARRSRGVWALALTVLAGLGASRSVAAQTGVLDQPSPVRGVFIPGGAIAGDADATSGSLNPGQWGLVDASSSALVFDHWADDVQREGRGLGLLVAQPISRGFGLGLGLEWLRPTLAGFPENYGKFTLGAGFRLGRRLAVGGAWEHLFGSRWGGLDSASFGLGYRLHDTVALGLVVRDTFRPRVDFPGIGNDELPREWDSELALRPFGTKVLELAGGVRALRANDETRWLPHARLSAQLYRGVALFADFEAARLRNTFADAMGQPQQPQDLRFSLGLALGLHRGNFAASSLATYRRDRPPGGDEGLGALGFGLVLRVSEEREATLFSPRAVARLKLEGLESDRSFLPALLALRRLGEDRAVSAVLLKIEDLELGYGRIEELRTAIVALAQKKPVFAWVDNPGMAEYYLASACQRVLMHPAGGLFLSGLAQSTTFWKGAMDRLGVAVDLVRIAEYKGAMEPFVFTQQSEPVRENRTALVDDLFARITRGIAEGRAAHGFNASKVKTAIDKALYSPAQAKDQGLVDELAADEKEVEKLLEKALGRRLSIRAADLSPFDLGRWVPRRVAVILVDGAIADGKPTGFPNTGIVAWADPLVDALEAVRKDGSIGAVVLRVNSPGGSAFASDRIARAVKRVREAKKPVIVSMGDLAASGGYYVAAPSDAIYASPSVVTGSIGIFAYNVDVSGLATKLGINNEVIARGALATLYSPWKPWSENERTAITGRLEQSYRQFLRVVADGRKSLGITEMKADALGRGRVYTGEQAKANGLVDQLGSFSEALNEATRRGGVPTGFAGLPELVVLPKPITDPLKALMALGGVGAGETDEDDARRAAAAEDGRTGKVGWSEPPASAPLFPPAALDTAAALLSREGKALRRLILPILIGNRTGLEARLPYELEFR